MTVHTTPKKHSIPNFEVRSALLLAAFAMGAVTAAQAQTSVPASPTNPNSPPSQMTTASTAAAIPQNRTTNQDLEAAFNRADTNGDGKLSRQEAEHFPALSQRFDQIDTNHKGYITREEFYKAAGAAP